MSEISTLTRTVQKLNTQIMNSQAEGSLGPAVSSLSVGPPIPTNQNISVPGMPQFHDYLDSTQRRTSLSANNMPLPAVASKPVLPSLRRESDPNAILGDMQDSSNTHCRVRFEPRESSSTTGDVRVGSTVLAADLEENAASAAATASASAAATATSTATGTATDEVSAKESKDAFADEEVEGSNAADAEEVEEKGHAGAADEHGKGIGADDVGAHQPVSDIDPKDTSGGDSVAAPEATQDVIIEQKTAKPKDEEDLIIRNSGGLTGKDSES